MKTIATLHLLLAATISLFAQAPPPTGPTSEAQREAASRALLDLIYAEAGRTNPAGRTLPTRLNAPTNAPTNRAAASAAAATSATDLPVVPAAAPAETVTPAAATGAAPANNRAPRALPAPPALPVPGAAASPTPRPPVPAAAVATPVIPGAPNPNAANAANPAAPNFNAAVPPANVNAANAANAAGAPAGAAPDAAKPPNPEDEVFPPGLIKFSEADLSQVLEIYQELTGRTVLKPNNLPQAKITIRSQTQLTRAEAVQALDSILSMNGITMVPQGDKFVKALAEGQANQAGKRFDDLPWELLPESGTIVTYLVQLTNAAPQEVATVLQQFAKLPGNSILAIPSTSMLVLRDYAENVKRMLEMIQRIDVVPQQEFVDVVIPIKYALAGDIAEVLGSLTSGGGGGTTTVGRQQTRTGLSGAGGFGGGAGGPGSPGYNPNNPFGQQQNALGAGGLGGSGANRSSFASRLNQIVNRASGATAGANGDIFVLGQTKIIADERTNSLLIFASKADLTTISNIIGKLDVVLAQVLIEAMVMEVSVGNKLDYGFSYIQKNPTTFGNAIGAGAINPGSIIRLISGAATNGFPAGGFSYAANFMNFDAAMTAMASDSRVNVISRPRIQTSHAVEANLFVGQTRPYVTGQSQYFGGGPQTQFQQQQIGLTLSVLPLINAEGLVVMDIKVKSQNIGENIPIDANFSVPETVDREAAAKVAVRDRETIMLGGFISKRKSVSKAGVPILKDIPVLGALFRSTGNDDQRVELIVLIRPTVLPSPMDAAIFAADERRRLPAVRGAERDYLEDTEKRQKAEDHYQSKELRKLYKKEGFSN